MMAIGAARSTVILVVHLLLIIMLALRSSAATSSISSSLRSRRRAFALTQQHFFWSTVRGGSAEPDQTTLDVSVGRKPIQETLIYPVSVCSVRGLRDYMEDDFFVASDFAAVFDGHGGEAVSKYLRQNLYASMQACLPSSVKKSSSSSGGSLDPKSLDLLADSLTTNESTAAAASPVTIKDYEKALVRALNKVDRQVLRISHWSFQGSTAVACWILPLDLVDEKGDNEEEDLQSEDPRTDASSQTDNDAATSTQQRLPSRRTHTLLTANIGDSRAVLSRNKTSIIELTRDHKPNDPLEQQRIERVGGTIVWHGSIDRHGNPVPGTGVWRVNGNLALARAIGDRSERPAVTSEPELSIIQLTKDDDFVIIATDGLWDVMSSCDCVAFVHALIEEAEEMGPVDYDAIAIMLVEEALRRGSYDNITVVMMWL